jgi:tryptophan synthase alpha chain
MNRIDRLFADKKEQVLSLYYTAGYPKLEDTMSILQALEEYGADLTEIGIPFSDPLADGPVLQQSSAQALANGMTLEFLFEQLRNCRDTIQMPILLMGYLNPLLQFGMERFVVCCQETGIDGVILPDLPPEEFESRYRQLWQRAGIHMIFMITPETSEARIRMIDGLSGGFIYMVSSSSTTGTEKKLQNMVQYFDRIREMKLMHPVLTGFGIGDRGSFELACQHASGAVIGTAFVKALSEKKDTREATAHFLQNILGSTLHT